MTDDRALLEAAAKAAGDGLFYEWEQDGRVLRYVGMREWNPLENDGDALRLAVELRIDIAQFKESVRADVTGYDDCHESNGSDPYAATRRAIVRAAAAMAKS